MDTLGRGTCAAKRPGMRSSNILPLPLLTAALAGCQAAVDGSVEESGAAATSRGAGTITVTAPPGAAAAKVRLRRKDVEDSKVVELGESVTLQAATYCVSTIVGRIESQPACDVTLEEGRHLDYALGGARFVRSKNALVIGIDPEVTDSATPLAFLAQSGAVPHPAGSFEYQTALVVVDERTELSTKTAFRVEAGATRDVDLNATDESTLLFLPPQRTLPTASTAKTVTVVAKASNREYRSEASIGLATLGADLGGRPVMLRGTVGDHFNRLARIQVEVAGGKYDLAGKREVKIGRIDVPDPVVTMSDGSKRTVKADVVVEGVWWSTKQELSSGNGVDVGLGDWRVSTSYVSPIDGMQVVERTGITIR
jgi:hypothetical protein